MQIDRVRAAMAPLVLALACGLAAAAPQALDHVPEDAAVVVGVRNVGDLLADMDRANILMGDRGSPELGFMTTMVRGMPGLNLEGSAAFVMSAPGGMPDADNMVIILPVTDFAAFTQGGDPAGGVTAVNIGPGPAFAKPLGEGFAAIGQHDSVVREFKGEAGRLAAHARRLGASGRAIADTADITIVADVDPFRDQLLQGMQQMQQQAMMFAAMSGAGQEAGAPINAMVEMLRGYVRDAGAGVLGVTYDDAGFAFDMGVQFSEGTESAEAFDHTGDASTLLSRVPAGPFYAAFAMDTRGKAAARLFGQLGAMQPAGQGQMPGQPGMAEILEHATGAAGVIGTSPAMMSAGMLSKYVTYTRTNDANAYAEVITGALAEADGQSTQGMNLTTTVQKNATTIAGVPVDAYGMKMSMGEDAGGMGMMNPQMMLSMLFGPSQGPEGYIARLDSGVIQTMSKDSALTEKAIGAAKNANGLGTDAAIRRVASKLPAGRFFEGYLAVDQVYNAAGPILMMTGVVQNADAIPPMPPAAFGASSIGGGLHGRLFVPSEVIAKSLELAPKSQPVFQDDWDDENDWDDQDEDLDF